MTKDELQFDLLKTELELVQRQIDKYDQISSTVKTWTVTLWAASLGWSFQTKQEGIVLISVFIVMAFWLFDASNKNFRQDYKKRRDEISVALRKIFKGEPSGERVVSPDLPLHEWRRLPGKIFEAHVSILYLSLLLASLIVLWLV